jgi:hypothetical protein
MKLPAFLYSKIAFVTCFIACAGDFAVTFIIGFMHKNYNFLNQSESYLGTDDSPVAWYMNTWGVLFSFLFVTCAYSFYKSFSLKNKWVVIAAFLIAVYGLGEGVGSGLFPYNHVGGELTLTGKLHSLFSGIGVTALNILPFILMKLFNKLKFPQLNLYFLFVGISGLFLVMMFLLAKEQLVPLKGLWQRLFILDYYIMLIVLMTRVKPVAENSITVS